MNFSGSCFSWLLYNLPFARVYEIFPEWQRRHRTTPKDRRQIAVAKGVFVMFKITYSCRQRRLEKWFDLHNPTFAGRTVL